MNQDLVFPETRIKHGGKRSYACSGSDPVGRTRLTRKLTSGTGNENHISLF